MNMSMNKLQNLKLSAPATMTIKGLMREKLSGLIKKGKFKNA